MRALISEQLRRRLQPAAAPFEVRDSRQAGLILRVQPSGRHVYYVQYQRGHRKRIGPADHWSPDEARGEAKKVLGDFEHGIDPAAERRRARAHTWATFRDAVYLPWLRAQLRKANAKRAEQRLRGFPELDGIKLGELTAWHVEKWRAARLRAGTSKSTVNRDLAELRAALGRAVEWEHLAAHPLAGLKLARLDRVPVVRYLSADEETRLRAALDAREAKARGARERANAWRRARGYAELPAAAPEPLRPLVLLLMNTGLRRGEAFNLRWPDVDLERGRLTVQGAGAKGGQTRVVPLNAEAREAVLAWHDHAAGDGYVFPGREGERRDNIRKAWSGLLRESRISGFRLHDLRHTFASRLVMAGVDLNTVRELLGHADLRMTLRYAHLAPAHLEAAVARLVRA
jgi:integrase